MGNPSGCKGVNQKILTVVITTALHQILFHFVLNMQCNEAGSSSGMEFLGHQRAFAYLFTTAVKIKSFISDRHRSIAKWMRETCPKKCRELNKPVVEHFFDLWHVAKRKTTNIIGVKQ